MEKDVALCEKSGFTVFELRFDMVKKYLDTHTFADLKVLFQTHSVRPVTINAIFDINFANEDEWKRITEQFTFACQISEVTGARTVIIVPGTFDGTATREWQEIADDSAKALTRLAHMGEPYGMKLAFEPIGAPNRYVRSIAEGWEVVQAVAREDVGIAADLYNQYLYGNWEHELDALRCLPAEKIHIVHLNDVEALPFEQLGTWNRTLPGDGIADCSAYLQAICLTGYDAVVSVETLSHRLWSIPPELLIPEAYQKTSRALAASYT